MPWNMEMSAVPCRWGALQVPCWMGDRSPKNQVVLRRKTGFHQGIYSDLMGFIVIYSDLMGFIRRKSWDVNPIKSVDLGEYPLVNIQKTMENHGKIHHFEWENPRFQWPFSIATLNYQRVMIPQLFCWFKDLVGGDWNMNGWFFHIWDLLPSFPTDELTPSFFREVGQPPTSKKPWKSQTCLMETSLNQPQQLPGSNC